MTAPKRAKDGDTTDKPQDDDALSEKAARIRALMAGTLDPAIDPRALFQVGLDDFEDRPELAFDALVRRVDALQATARRPKRKGLPKITDTRAGEKGVAEQLFDARAEFLALPYSEQERMFADHEARRVALKNAAKKAELQQQRLDEIQHKSAQLEAFLEKRLDVALDPRTLIELNLSDPDELAIHVARRQAFLEVATTSDTTVPPPSLVDGENNLGEPERVSNEGQTTIEKDLVKAEVTLDIFRRRYLDLSDSKRADLYKAHEERRAAAEAEAGLSSREEEQISQSETEAMKVAAQQEKAIIAARQARTEARRLLEEERGRLLGVKAAHARFKAALAKGRAATSTDGERALTWNRLIRELEDRSVLDGDKAIDADGLYNRLIRELSDVRTALRGALATRPSQTPSPRMETAFPGRLDDREIKTLREALEKAETALRVEEQGLRWDQATSHRDAMVSMNRARLRLFPMLSNSKRASLTGFGPEGVRQVRRELEQIALETRYHLSALPNYTKAKLRDIKTSPLPIIFSLLKLIALAVVFRWWRRRADGLLGKVLESQLLRESGNLLSGTLETISWYTKKIRRPLEWLLLAYVLTGMIGASFANFGELQYIWTILWKILLWTLLGSFLVQLLNAIAQRQGKSSAASAGLRLRSLKLVGVSVVLVGLTLSLAKVMVGQGAIYGWVISTFWLLAIPILTVLVAWWKHTIFVRIAARVTTNALVLWVRAHSTGPVSYAAAIVGGAYLLGDGIYRFFLRQASHLAVTKKVLAYMFRREVEKHASATADDSQYFRIDKSQYDALAPVPNEQHLVSGYMHEEIEVVRQLVRSDNNAVVALLGERGLGKTTFVNRVIEGLAPGEYFRVSCDPGGFSQFIHQMAGVLKLSENIGEDEIVVRLKHKPPTAVFVDNAQRLIRPLIGGLKDIDQLIQFAHRVGPTTSWLIAVESPAWQYLSRARGERAVFDEHVTLRPWTEEEIAELVSRRSEAVGVSPSFEKLVVPRRVEATQMSGEERTRKDFYRFLWDHSDGNPVVALHFWRESLFRNEGNGQIFVRLFKFPSPDLLADLPNTLYFVLRAVVQLELALEVDIIRCTDLRPADVADALRAAKSKGYIEYRGDRVRIALPWYRAVTDVLRRQHLLIM